MFFCTLMLIAFQSTLTDTLWAETTEGYSINVSYPQIVLENQAIGNRLQEYATGHVEDFKYQFTEDLSFDPLQQGWILELNMVQEESPEGMVCIAAWLWSYTGGAHGNTMTQAFNFDLSTGEVIGVIDLLGGQTRFEAFAGKVIAYLNTTLLDENWIERGASADPANYHTVLPVPGENGNISGYTVLFPPYQVDCYAGGTIEVFVPSP